jgi:hypothetical protein
VTGNGGATATVQSSQFDPVTKAVPGTIAEPPLASIE